MHRSWIDNCKRLGAISAAALALGACGGGGGDPGGGATPAAIDITAANQDKVARTAAVGFQAGLVSNSAGAVGGGTPSPLGVDRKSALHAAPSFARSSPLSVALRAVISRAPAREAAQNVGRVKSAALHDLGVTACRVSGSYSGTVDDRDNSQTTGIGDLITIVFASCAMDTAAETVNGTLTLSLSQFTATPHLSLVAAATFANFTVVNTSDGNSARYDGGFTLSLAEPSATLSTLRLVVSSALAAQVTTPAYSDTVTLQAGYTVDSVHDSSILPPGGTVPGRAATTIGGKLSSAAAGGMVEIATQAGIVQYDVDLFPRSGLLKVVGPGSAMLVTVLSTTEVQLDLDADGNGSYETRKIVTWDFLL